MIYMVKLTDEGITKYPFFSDTIHVLKETEDKYLVKDKLGRKAWIDKTDVAGAEAPAKKKRKKKVVEETIQ